MRKQTEISLVAKRPHLFQQSIVTALGITIDGQPVLKSNEVHSRWNYKVEDFFECGEGWLPIIEAFTESIDHFISEVEIARAESEINTDIHISGALRHQCRLYIVVSMPPNIDELLLSKIKAMQEFSAAMSGFICEVCGTPVRDVELNSRVQCAVCHYRHA